MVTHWESSRRPLYVKTVWRDGQHHVILDKIKENSLETSQSRKAKQCLSSQNSYRSAKSTNSGLNLKVSSVRVLLSGVNGFKQSQKSSRTQDYFSDKPRTWIKPSTNRPITCKDLNKEVTFNTIQGTRPPNLYKSKTVDSECLMIEKPCEPIIDYVSNNALSERVMVWLDLATNSGYIDTELKQNGAVVAQACQLKEKHMKICDFKDNIDVEEVTDSSILKNGSPRPELEKEEMIVLSNEEVEVPEKDFYHVLTPNPKECRDYEVKEDNKKSINNFKRQLHIFMPNLPKKSSDCNSSILSSKISVS